MVSQCFPASWLYSFASYNWNKMNHRMNLSPKIVIRHYLPFSFLHEHTAAMKKMSILQHFGMVPICCSPSLLVDFITYCTLSWLIAVWSPLTMWEKDVPEFTKPWLTDDCFILNNVDRGHLLTLFGQGHLRYWGCHPHIHQNSSLTIPPPTSVFPQMEQASCAPLQNLTY